MPDFTNFQNETEAELAKEWAGAGCAAPSGSASPLAARLNAMRDNVKRYYDLCVIVRNAKDEMKLLNDQFEDIAKNCHDEDPVEWLLSGRDVPAIREWEAENPQWIVSGNGVRKRKQNKDCCCCLDHRGPKANATQATDNDRGSSSLERPNCASGGW